MDGRDAARFEVDAKRGEPAGEVFDSIRPYLYLTGVGSIYASVESVRGFVRRSVGPGARSYRSLRPLPFFRLAFAAINVVGMFGVFLLARELTRSFAGGLAALVLALLESRDSNRIGTPALDALEARARLGLGLEGPQDLGPLMVARLRREYGDTHVR